MDDLEHARADDNWDDPYAGCGYMLCGGRPLHLVALSPTVLKSTLEIIGEGQEPHVVVIADVGTALHHYLAKS